MEKMKLTYAGELHQQCPYCHKDFVILLNKKTMTLEEYRAYAKQKVKETKRKQKFNITLST